MQRAVCDQNYVERYRTVRMKNCEPNTTLDWCFWRCSYRRRSNIATSFQLIFWSLLVICVLYSWRKAVPKVLVGRRYGKMRLHFAESQKLRALPCFITVFESFAKKIIRCYQRKLQTKYIGKRPTMSHDAKYFPQEQRINHFAYEVLRRVPKFS